MNDIEKKFWATGNEDYKVPTLYCYGDGRWFADIRDARGPHAIGRGTNPLQAMEEALNAHKERMGGEVALDNELRQRKIIQ
jgi:hypothetical protein